MAEWLQDAGKSFKLGFGSSPSRSFSVLVHHCFPLRTILYARNLLTSSLHDMRSRERMHARARHETERGRNRSVEGSGSTYIHG